MEERQTGPSPLAEFRNGWRTVGGAAFGVGLGVSGLLTYNIGLFADALGQDIGLSRTAYGAAFFGSTVALAAAMPLVGRMVDRLGSRVTAAIGAVALALGFIGLAGVQTVAGFVAMMVAIGLFAAPSSPVAHTRAVAGAFIRARGLALGITQVGIGVAAAAVPPVIGLRIAEHGWRDGFLALALLAALGLLPILAGLPGKAPSQRQAAATDAASFRAIRGSRPFLVQIAAFSAMAFAFAGMLSHFVPMLRQDGMPIAQAGAMAGLIGMSVIVTRIVVGWLSDRLDPAWLGAASCAICAAGCLVLALGGPAQLGAVALGAAMGAEADLIGILTARNFAIAAYSRAYALQYAAFGIAAGVSPLWIGYLADLTGDYRASLFACTALLIVPIALFGALPAALRRFPPTP